MKFVLCALALFILVGIFFSNGKEGVQLAAPATAVDEIISPAGYDFVDMTSYGPYAGNNIYFFREKSSGKIFTSDGKNILSEVKVPKGYTFIRASSYGKSSCNMIYIIQNDTDGKIYRLKP